MVITVIIISIKYVLAFPFLIDGICSLLAHLCWSWDLTQPEDSETLVLADSVVLLRWRERDRCQIPIVIIAGALVRKGCKIQPRMS